MENTRQLVAESVHAEANAVDDEEEDSNRPDDTDDPEDMVEFEAWKIRELGRIRRDHDARMRIREEQVEVMRRRGLTDEQREQEDALERAGKPEKEKRAVR